jgi:hypothetical protein
MAATTYDRALHEGTEYLEDRIMNRANRPVLRGVSVSPRVFARRRERRLGCASTVPARCRDA